MDDGQDPTSAWYSEATRLNAKLAVEPSAELIAKGLSLGEQMLNHVRTEVGDFDAFVERVKRSEDYSLHDSMQVTKKEKSLKLLYVRAQGLLEAAEEAKRFRR